MQINGKEICIVRERRLTMNGKEYKQRYITIPAKSPLQIGNSVEIIPRKLTVE